MTSIVVTMIIIVSLGVVALAVVAIGMRGAFSENVPTVADRLAVVGHHLNGEADAPAGLLKAYDFGSQQLRKVGRDSA